MIDPTQRAESQAALDRVAASNRFPTTERTPWIIRMQTRYSRLISGVCIGFGLWTMFNLLRLHGWLP